MEQENQLERKIKPDWKDWIPIVGIYFIQRNLSKNGRSIYHDIPSLLGFNAVYHAFAIITPVIYLISKID